MNCIRFLLFSIVAKIVVGNRVWKLEKFDLEKYPQAKCLDGSPGGFWFLSGEGAGLDKFVIHHQGGGWCIDENDCYQRSLTASGSSVTWATEADCSTDSTAAPCSYDGGSHGLLEIDSSINTFTHDWNMVYLGYCDGASFSGHVVEDIPVPDHSGTVMHFKGRWILDAAYEILLSKYAMNKASAVVISGCSAGGLSVFLHTDYLKTKIVTASVAASPPRVSAIVDAGYFMDLPSIDGTYLYTPYYQYVFEMQQVADSVDDDCISFYTPTNETWKCFMAQYTLPHVQTEIFLANSMADNWQGYNIMGITCDPTVKGSCSDDVFDYLNDFREKMLESLKGFFRSPNGGAWLCECWVHPILDTNYFWNGVLVENQTMQEVILQWYNRSSSLLQSRKTVVIDGNFGSNSC